MLFVDVKVDKNEIFGPLATVAPKERVKNGEYPPTSRGQDNEKGT